MKLFVRIGLVILGLVFLVLVGAYFYVQSDAPDYQKGEITLSGWKNPPTSGSTIMASPTSLPKTEADAYYALGYVHASERLFQMEMLRRVATGRLSEVIGPDVLDVDVLFRTLGMHEISKQSVQTYFNEQDGDFQRAARAYLAGVNAFIDEGEDPLEFDILGIEKTPFTLENLFDVSGYMSYGFASGLKQEPIVERIAQHLGPEYLADLGLRYQEGKQRIHTYTQPSQAAPASPTMAYHARKSWTNSLLLPGWGPTPGCWDPNALLPIT
jgi:penicillin amidase